MQSPSPNETLDPIDRADEPPALSGREIRYALLGVAVGLLILAGLWWRAGGSTAALPTLSEVTPYPAPPFTIEQLGGGTISLDDVRGKVVVLNFWATWCLPCQEETPDLQAVYSQFKNEGLAIIGVDLFDQERAQGRGLADVQAFTSRFGVRYPIGLDRGGSVAKQYAIAPIPTSYFIDQQGRVRFIRVGKLSRQDVERVFRQLQAEQAAGGAPN